MTGIVGLRPGRPPRWARGAGPPGHPSERGESRWSPACVGGVVRGLSQSPVTWAPWRVPALIGSTMGSHRHRRAPSNPAVVAR